LLFLLQLRRVADDKKTQFGSASGNVPTSSPPVASGTPVPAAPAPSGPVKTSYLPTAPDPLLGATVAGRYRVERKLGEGGMGAVYLASHAVLEKRIALKVLHGEFARKPDLVERFMQEAKAASRIRHENVIDISDFGSTPEGLVFFAMELLTGHDLHDEIARARVAGNMLPWSRTKKIFLQVCSALAAAHAKGVVHRDLKPENVYLVQFLDDPDFVKLLDFGIAKLTEVNEQGGRKLTRTGMLFGTPEYMSPEQARGESIDHRVDIYAMGCILFQLVSGRVPFEADNFMGVLSQHLTEPPPVIAPMVFDHIGAPRALSGVIARALAKDRADRFQTIDELAAAVHEVCGDPMSARGTRTREPSVPAPIVAATRKPTQRTRTEWTGKISVPEVEEELSTPAGAARRRGSPWLALGAAAIVIAGGVTAVVLARGSTAPTDTGSDNSSTQGSQLPRGSAASPAASTGSAIGSDSVASRGSGSATSSNTVASPGSAAAPPQAAAPPAIPETARLTFASTPQGATVIDPSTGKPVGRTPLTLSIPGSTAPRQFGFHLHGYIDATFEVVPDREALTYTATLVRASATTRALHAATVQREAAATGAVTTPEVDTAVTHPEHGTAAKPEPSNPEPIKPAVKDVKTPEPAKSDDCGDGSEPCLKRNIPGLGSSSGS
jgi:serine/threonine-protein kinase